MKQIAIYKCAYQSLWHFLAIFVGFAFPPLPEVRADLMQLLDDAAPRSSSTPTTHQTRYILNSTHDEVHYVHNCSSESGSLLNTFGVFGLHAAAAPRTMAFLADGA